MGSVPFPADDTELIHPVLRAQETENGFHACINHRIKNYPVRVKRRNKRQLNDLGGEKNAS